MLSPFLIASHVRTPDHLTFKMALKKENYYGNKPVCRRARKATHQGVKIGDFVQTTGSDEISEFSNGFEEKEVNGYSEDEDSDDDIMSRVESVVAAAAKIKRRRIGETGMTVEKTRRPLETLQEVGHDNGRSKMTKLPKTVAITREEETIHEEVSRLHSSSSQLSALDFLGDDTSSEIQALANQADLLAASQHLANDPRVNKTEETVIQLLDELSKQSGLVRALTSQNEDAMRKISSFEQLVREKDQEIEDGNYYNEMNDCANEKMLKFASERYEKQLNEQQQRIANLITIIQRQQVGQDDCVYSMIREKCMLQKELSILKRHLNEEALMDKQHLKRVQCAVAVTALVATYVGLLAGLDSFLYTAPFYFLFVFFVLA